jgi:hypothetical protein
MYYLVSLIQQANGVLTMVTADGTELLEDKPLVLPGSLKIACRIADKYSRLESPPIIMSPFGNINCEAIRSPESSVVRSEKPCLSTN